VARRAPPRPAENVDRLADVTNRASPVTVDTSNVVASQGVVASTFAGITAGDP
jgi:hypothetical protein